MPIEIYMPALSPTMEKGTLAKWLVSEGDSVSAGDVIAEIETDKATMEVESIDDGKMGRIIVSEGTEDVPVGEKIALLLTEDEDDSALGDPPTARGAKVEAEPRADHGHPPGQSAEAAQPAPQPGEGKQTQAAAATPTPEPAHKGNGAAPPAPTTDSGERVFASPLARRMAKQMGVDLTGISGSGPRGRIIKADVEAAAGKAPAGAPAEAPAAAHAAPAAEAPGFEPPADVPYEEVKLPGMRKVIAKRMTQSKSHVPHFYLTIDVALDKLLGQRRTLNETLADEGVKLSVNDFIIRACALGLKKVPAANAMYAGEKMYCFTRQDISVAVAIEGGLITPVIKDAGSKGLTEISKEMKALAAKAREGKLMPEDYQGGTFSLSNLGMYGVREFGAVINPPQGAILAVGQGEKRAVVLDDAVQIKTVMSCTLSVDHRVLDGAIGSEFLSAFKGYIEEPMTMLL